MPDYPPPAESDDFSDFAEWIPRLVPHFGPGAFVPGSPCPHPKSGYKPGEPFYCPRCHISGQDHSHYLRMPVKSKPPEPLHEPTKYAGPNSPAAKPTRKERRSRKNKPEGTSPDAIAPA